MSSRDHLLYCVGQPDTCEQCSQEISFNGAYWEHDSEPVNPHASTPRIGVRYAGDSEGTESLVCQLKQILTPAIKAAMEREINLNPFHDFLTDEDKALIEAGEVLGI